VVEGQKGTFIMTRKASNVSLVVAAKALDQDAAADDAFVRGASASSTKASKRQSVEPKTPKRRLTVYLPEEVALALERLAVEERSNVSALLEKGAVALLQRHSGKAP
jgi:hypothetical protein